MFPGTLVLSYNSLVMHNKLVQLITEENGVPFEEGAKRVLGPYMCVPFGKILNHMAVPNTVTKTLHLEKCFSPDLSGFHIKEYPNYASIEDQVKTIHSFRRSAILVDDILHKGYRMQRLDPILTENGVRVHKLIVGILSGNGKDLMAVQKRSVDSVYFLPNLKAWFVESSLYPFIGGDGVERHTGTIDDDFTAINLILPYVLPGFLSKRCSKAAIYNFSNSQNPGGRIPEGIPEKAHAAAAAGSGTRTEADRCGTVSGLRPGTCRKHIRRGRYREAAKAERTDQRLT